ncbi:MAG TPA: methyltransferase domain-containing protein [Candidatus Bathyarchaeia archaeon]
MRKSEVEEYYDRHAKSYSPRGFSPDNTRNSLYFADQILWHFLKKYAPRKKSSLILDAGAGTGDWALLFAKLGYRRMVLADISSGMLDEARRKFEGLETVDVSFVRSDISKLKEFATGTFDFVYSQYDAVSLCLRPRAAVKALARVAKDGAYVIASMDTKFARVPRLIERWKLSQAVELLKTSIAVDAWDEWEDQEYPSRPLTWEELAEYFEEAGLQVVEVIGAEVFTSYIRKSVLDRLKADPKARRILIKIELEHCTNRSLVNMAGHLQMVGLRT